MILSELLGVVVAVLLAGALANGTGVVVGSAPRPASELPGGTVLAGASGTNASVVQNFSASLQRILTLLGAAGGAILALAWARVALSWFSTDVTKKVQAKDRARDALIGTVLFAAALSGIVWGLAQWVLTGS